MMRKSLSLSCLLIAAVASSASRAQPALDEPLRVIKPSVNADSDNAELCLEFDRPLATSPATRLSGQLRLEQDGKQVTPRNIVPTASSLCLFPLERGQPYHLTLNGLRGAQNEKMAAPYSLSFTIPDRSPLLAFTGVNGGLNGFGSYDGPLLLRAVNVTHATLEIYRISDGAAMAHIWQDRAQTSLAPSESAYLAREKGVLAWKTDIAFDAAANVTSEKKILLREKLPDLAPGLYLMIADAGSKTDKPASKGLAPLAATWLTKSDFTLQAVRDGDGVHAFAAGGTAPKGDLHIVALNRKAEPVAETRIDKTGIGFIATPTADPNAIATLIATDSAGNVAFADIDALPTLPTAGASGTIALDDSPAFPGEPVSLSLALPPPTDNGQTGNSFVRLGRGAAPYADFPVTPTTKESGHVAFTAPAAGLWSLRWQKADGALLAEQTLNVTVNADAPHLDITADQDDISAQSAPGITVHAQTASGREAPLVSGRVMAMWQRSDPAALGWKDYHFGTAAAIVNAPVPVGDFLTDLQGTAHSRVTLPKPPPEPGLYQIALTTETDSAQGASEAAPRLLPLRPDSPIIGIRPLSEQARFGQNSLARFALIALSSDGKPRDDNSLSYQIYEEGRSFAWFQDEGRWNYKPEPQLRPIGGGALSIRADGGSLLEWPVTSGNYRLQILDANEKIVAQSNFSAGWDSTTAAAPMGLLALSAPSQAQPGRESAVHFTLPAPSMITALIGDDRLRKAVHEFRPKGDNSLTFTPAADWQNGVSVTVTATTETAPLRGTAQIPLLHKATTESPARKSDAALTSPLPPAAIPLRAGGSATLAFVIGNRGSATETYSYGLTASPGLKLDSGDKGSVTIPGGQSRNLSLQVTGVTPGSAEIKLDVSGTHTPRSSRVWPAAILPSEDFLRSATTVTVPPQQNLLSAIMPKTHGAADKTIALVARRPLDGVADLLSFLIAQQPFTTTELGLGIDALRQWSDMLAQTGLAPDTALAARRQEWLLRLLQHQNPDGGFAALRGGDSSLSDTAMALTALGSDNGELAKPARTLAVAWLRQRLSNTWFDEKEREARADAYAGLAAAGAIDSASLHYFSDTGATLPLSALAEAHIAAAFKQARDPNAAAFWIKKMLDEHSGAQDARLLNALAATDALSADAVHAALQAQTDSLHQGHAPNLADVAALLRAAASSLATAGKTRVTTGSQTRDGAGVYVLRLSDAATASLRNDDSQPLFVTPVTLTQQPDGATETPVTRRIYRLNGVEVTPQTRLSRTDTYVVEVSGSRDVSAGDERQILQDGTDALLRPVGCPLSAHLDTLAFIPWLVPRELSAFDSCDKTARGLNILLPSDGDDKARFKYVYFAHTDAPTPAALAAPRLRNVR